jgi:hypothetical protein
MLHVGFQVSSLGFRVSCCVFRVSGLGSRVPGFGFDVLGFGSRAFGSPEFKVLGFGSRASGLKYRAGGAAGGGPARMRLEERLVLPRVRAPVVGVVLRLRQSTLEIKIVAGD